MLFLRLLRLKPQVRYASERCRRPTFLGWYGSLRLVVHLVLGWLEVEHGLQVDNPCILSRIHLLRRLLLIKRIRARILRFVYFQGWNEGSLLVLEGFGRFDSRALFIQKCYSIQRLLIFLVWIWTLWTVIFYRQIRHIFCQFHTSCGWPKPRRFFQIRIIFIFVDGELIPWFLRRMPLQSASQPQLAWLPLLFDFTTYVGEISGRDIFRAVLESLGIEGVLHLMSTCISGLFIIGFQVPLWVRPNREETGLVVASGLLKYPWGFLSHLVEIWIFKLCVVKLMHSFFYFYMK